MKKGLIVLFFACIACSGGQKNQEKLDEDEMVKILVDIHLAESKVNAMHFGSTDSSIVAYSVLEKKLFKKHGIDSLTFKRSFDAYVKEPEELGILYNRVTVQLKREAKSLMKK